MKDTDKIDNLLAIVGKLAKDKLALASSVMAKLIERNRELEEKLAQKTGQLNYLKEMLAEHSSATVEVLEVMIEAYNETS